MSKGELIDILVSEFQYKEHEIDSYSKQILINLYKDLLKFK